MENLQIEIDGATFTAKKPKARIWAKMAEFDENIFCNRCPYL